MESSRARGATPATDPIPDGAAMAHASGLDYVCDADPGITRLGKGKRFAYLDPDNRAITDAATLARIAGLAVERWMPAGFMFTVAPMHPLRPIGGAFDSNASLAGKTSKPLGRKPERATRHRQK